jgi:PAS domain S-box-containing protein
VVSDYEMLQKNGLDFLKALREKSNQIPFILFTGKGREDVAVKALNLGADSYINKNGSPETVYCELADAINKTVERKKSRELLAKSESKYHAIVENSLQGILILQAAPIRIVFANGAFGKILGYSSEELTSLSPEEIMSLVYHEDRAVFFKRMENRLRGEPAGACYEFRAVRKDGSLIWLSSLANRVEYDGQPAVQGMFLDINESKKASKILYESEQRYRELANSLPETVFETDLTGRITFLSQRAFELIGLTREELEKGLNMLSFVVPEEREKAKENLRKAFSGEKRGDNEYRLCKKDGATLPVLVRTNPIISENEVTGLRGLVIDITERKKAEEIVRKSEERYRELANFLPEIVFETDLSGNITFFSQTAFEILSFTPGELEKGTNMLQFVVPEDRERAKENIRRRMAGEKSDTSEYLLFRKNGDTYPAIVKTAPIYSENKLIGLRGFVIDITERKNAETSLKEAKAQLELQIERMPIACIVWDKDFKAVSWNPAAQTIFGYSAKEAIGKHPYGTIVPKDAQPVVEKIWRRLLEGDETAHSVNDNFTKDGKKITCSWTNTPLKREGNSIIGILSMVQDITESKKAEQVLIGSEANYRNLINGMNESTWVIDFTGTF